MRLLIVARKTGYTLKFACAEKGGRISDIEVESKHLTKTPPAGQPFLGAMFGLYAFGNWEPCLDPAYFKDVVCEYN